MSAQGIRDVEQLRKRFAGGLVTPADPDYDQARRVWNATADRRPGLVARCATDEDVVSGLRFARDLGLPVAVRGGGHSYPGFSTCDEGVVIDLGPMRQVMVDPDRRIATVQAGALLKDLDVATQRYGLVCPNGAVGHTGVAGLTLGGGLGRLMRRFGLTIDNLIDVELITADGRGVRASADEHPELFWGLRGAGANFGIVTSFRLRLHPALTANYVNDLGDPGEHDLHDIYGRARYDRLVTVKRAWDPENVFRLNQNVAP
jgi:FAD/FMN-containing dehydrogenase